MQKKLKILSIILISALAVSVVLASNSAIAAWINISVVQVTTSTATSAFTTQVVGVYTNVIASAIDINGNSYNGASIATYNSGVISGNPNSPSVATISAGGWVPNDLVELQVTITNTGSTTLQFQPYLINCYFVDAGGNRISSGPFYNNNGYSTGELNQQEPWTFAGFYGQVGGGITDTLTFTSATDSTNRQVFADNLIDGNAVGNNINWEVGWGTIGATSIPTTLAPSASFVYNIYIGLGTNAPYNIPNMYFSLTVPMTVAN